MVGVSVFAEVVRLTLFRFLNHIKNGGKGGLAREGVAYFYRFLRKITTFYNILPLSHQNYHFPTKIITFLTTF